MPATNRAHRPAVKLSLWCAPAARSCPAAGRSSPLEDEAAANAEDVVEALENASLAKDVRAIVLRIDSPRRHLPRRRCHRRRGRPGTRRRQARDCLDGRRGGLGRLSRRRARRDVIIAQPTTITASIGVFSIWPMAQELLTSLGINVERVSVGRNAGMHSTFQPPSPAQRAAVNRELDVIYAAFTAQVAEFRNLDSNRIDAAAAPGVQRRRRQARGPGGTNSAACSSPSTSPRRRAGVDEGPQGRNPPLSQRWRTACSAVLDHLFKLAGVSTAPSLGMPREVREALAKFGVTARPGNVRLRHCRRSGARSLERAAPVAPSIARPYPGRQRRVASGTRPAAQDGSARDP